MFLFAISGALHMDPHASRPQGLYEDPRSSTSHLPSVPASRVRAKSPAIRPTVKTPTCDEPDKATIESSPHLCVSSSTRNLHNGSCAIWWCRAWCDGLPRLPGTDEGSQLWPPQGSPLARKASIPSFYQVPPLQYTGHNGEWAYVPRLGMWSLF